MRKIVIIFTILLAITCSVFSQSTKEYLKSNTFIFSSQDNTILSEAYSRYRFFIVGEYHFKESNSDIFLETFKNLYKNANVRIIFMEAGFSTGILINHYLKTGSTKTLDYLSLNRQFSKSHYIKLKEFYDSLPEHDRFMVIGVDLEIYETNDFFDYAVELIFNDTIIPDYTKELINEFTESTNDHELDYTETVFNNLYFDWKNNELKYDSILLENSELYAKLMTRTKSSYRFDYYNYNYGRDTIMQTRRERFIFENIIDEVKKYPNYNYFAQFGLAHIGLHRFLIVKDEYSFESFSTKLNKSQKSPIKDSVCSLAILYFDKDLKEYRSFLNSYSKFTYYLSRKKYLPNDIYKNLKEITTKDALYIVDMQKLGTPLKTPRNKNYQYLIFKK